LNTHNFLLARRAAELKQQYQYQAFLDIRSLPVAPGAIQNRIDRSFFRQTVTLAARRFDGVSYITEELREFCRRNFNLPPHNSEVWTSGVDLSLFRPEAKLFSEGALRLIYHGSIVENRGLENVVRALGLINHGRAEIIFLGDGSGLKDLKRLASSLGLAGRVTFHPSVLNEEVPRYIRDADLGILPFPDWPGWNTSSPLKLLEYLACGRPVIVTRIPAHLNAVGGQDFAFWAEASTPEALAGAIAEAERRRNEFDKLGRRAREFVGQYYTWEKQAGKLESFLLAAERDRSV
jgi:glycosyltransferase involved in cell wall biosynthesis